MENRLVCTNIYIHFCDRKTRCYYIYCSRYTNICSYMHTLYTPRRVVVRPVRARIYVYTYGNMYT